MARVLRYLWALPATAVGLVFAGLVVPRGRVAIVDGVVEAHGPILRWALSRLIPNRGGASAITLGHVVLGRDGTALESTRLHERVHVAQYEQWGPLFLPAYAASSLAACIRGGDYYLDNRFEREARAAEGDHRMPDSPTRIATVVGAEQRPPVSRLPFTTEVS